MTSTPIRLAALGLLLAAALPGRAEDHAARVPLLPAYVQECGSCHVAFAPGLLPASSWQHLMANLNAHYGSDASLDAATTQSLAGWLATHAGTGKRAAEAPRDDRITQAAWFTREHREVRSRFGSTAAKTTNPSPTGGTAVKTASLSPSDCAACHTRAAEGSYREREIRLPR